jgi:short subunit dehydrogenase-like uncharacterized protein
MRIAVYGASGLTGSLVARALDAAGADLVLAGRDALKLEAVAAQLARPAHVAIAPVDDPLALTDAFRGARVVVSCAGPFTTIGEPVLEAAIAAGAHYLDTSGEQPFHRAMYERHEADARRAHVCAIPGMALEIAPGDLAARVAAEALTGGAADPADGLLAEDDPLDEIEIVYLFDRFSPSAGTQRSAIAAAAAAPGVLWRNDRWDPIAPAAERIRVGDREAVSFPAGEVITIPRHVATRRVQTYVSLARSPWFSRAASLLGPALPFLARTMPTRLASWVPDLALDERERTDATFTIVAIARRGFEERTVSVSGRDVYATAAAIASHAALALATRGDLPSGVLAPSEVFAAGPTLDALRPLLNTESR